MTKKFAVTYQIEYIHRVMVGVTAPDPETATQLASEAFDAGLIWDDTDNLPLLFDDYEEADKGETLCFTAEEITSFPKPDASIMVIRRKADAFSACRQLLAGNIVNALEFARSAVGDVMDDPEFECGYCGRVYDDTTVCLSGDCPSLDSSIQ